MAVDGQCEKAAIERINERYKAWNELKTMPSTKGLSINVKMILYEGVVVPTVLYGQETCDLV